jgi:hypothetical protein
METAPLGGGVPAVVVAPTVLVAVVTLVPRVVAVLVLVVPARVEARVSPRPVPVVVPRVVPFRVVARLRSVSVGSSPLPGPLLSSSLPGPLFSSWLLLATTAAAWSLPGPNVAHSSGVAHNISTAKPRAASFRALEVSSPSKAASSLDICGKARGAGPG